MKLKKLALFAEPFHRYKGIACSDDFQTLTLLPFTDPRLFRQEPADDRPGTGARFLHRDHSGVARTSVRSLSERDDALHRRGGVVVWKSGILNAANRQRRLRLDHRADRSQTGHADRECAAHYCVGNAVLCADKYRAVCGRGVAGTGRGIDGVSNHDLCGGDQV